jgi:small-conductance mechanosensitive channel
LQLPVSPLLVKLACCEPGAIENLATTTSLKNFSRRTRTMKIRIKGLHLFTTFVLLAMFSAAAQTTGSDQSTEGQQVIPFLDQTIVWYRQLAGLQQLVSEPSDALFLTDNRQTADQVAQLSFEFARARAQALTTSGSAAANPGTSGTSQYQKLAELAAQASQRVKQSQQELEDMRKQLNSASGKKRRTLQATIAETESELALFEARRDAVQNILQVTGTGKMTTGSLLAQIDELARTVPAAAAQKEAGASGPAGGTPASLSGAVAAPEHRQQSSGLFGVISDLFVLRRKVNSLDDNVRLTNSLVESARALRSPLVTKMRELTQKGDQLAAQPDSTDPAVLAQQKNDLDALTAQYKQLSAGVLPLSRQSILLDIYKRSVSNWRNAVESQYESQLKGLLFRLAGLAVVLGVVVCFSELWRRATFRYVTDARRRNQFLLLRRIVLWSLIAVIIAVAFASELGAITTFAGLLTAGIALALQSVILSVVGYFFLIGKHGLRVGDRVQVAGITGDVVDIGMVRLHLMEVTGGVSPRPTGRVVAVSNAVVFQANAGMFKQIPGTSFLWHEITLTLGQENDYRQVEERMLEAVNRVYAEYREQMEMQRRSMERSLHSIRITSFAPESRVRLTASGLEVVIRYPVELSNAAEIDDRVTRELLEIIAREPRLRLLGAQIEAQSA